MISPNSAAPLFKVIRQLHFSRMNLFPPEKKKKTKNDKLYLQFTATWGVEFFSSLPAQKVNTLYWHICTLNKNPRWVSVMWPLYTYSCACLLKNISAIQSFASHHLCETLDSLFLKLQTACLKTYQPPSNKLPTSATLMMWCLMVGALQYYWVKPIKQLDNINWFKSLIFSFTLSLKYFSPQ